MLRSRGTGRAVLSSVDGLGPNGATPRTIARSPIHYERGLRKAPLVATEVFKEAPWQAYFASPIPASRIAFQEASPAPRVDVFCEDRPCLAPTVENLNPSVLSNAVLHRHSTDDAAANQALHEELSDAPDAVLTGGVYRKFLDGVCAHPNATNSSTAQLLFHPHQVMLTLHHRLIHRPRSPLCRRRRRSILPLQAKGRAGHLRARLWRPAASQPGHVARGNFPRIQAPASITIGGQTHAWRWTSKRAPTDGSLERGPGRKVPWIVCWSIRV